MTAEETTGEAPAESDASTEFSKRGWARWWDRSGDLAVTLVLTLGTLFTAWAGFQSAKWSGVQTVNFSEASSARDASNAYATLASNNASTETDVFIRWMEFAHPILTAGGDITEVTEGDSFAAFLYERFDEQSLKPAVDEWLAQGLYEPGSNVTPFEMPSYIPNGFQEAVDRRNLADELGAKARENNQQSDTYLMLTVTFASALFLAGLCRQLRDHRAQTVLLGTALIVLVAAIGFVLAQPVEFVRDDLPF